LIDGNSRRILEAPKRPVNVETVMLVEFDPGGRTLLIAAAV
jgi:hypothetical protein